MWNPRFSTTAPGHISIHQLSLPLTHTHTHTHTQTHTRKHTHTHTHTHTHSHTHTHLQISEALGWLRDACKIAARYYGPGHPSQLGPLLDYQAALQVRACTCLSALWAGVQCVQELMHANIRLWRNAFTHTFDLVTQCLIYVMCSPCGATCMIHCMIHCLIVLVCFCWSRFADQHVVCFCWSCFCWSPDKRLGMHKCKCRQ